MRMFHLELHKFVIVGILCASYVLYLFTSSVALSIFAAVAIFGALSAQRQQPSALGLAPQQNHAPNSRRRTVPKAEKSLSRDSFNNISKQVTPITPWGISKSNYSTLSSSVRSSPVLSPRNAPRNISRASCGFASQVVSTAYNYPPIDQSHYRGLGLFPTIHLNKSPLPVLSGKNTTMVHNPVTVRIAPPEKNLSPSPRKDFIFNSKVQTPSKSPVKSVLKSLQQIQRKRSFYMTEETEESQMKRQRREISVGVELTSKSPSSGNVSLLNGIRQPIPVYREEIVRQNTPMDTLSTSTPRVKTQKNNEIFSSYSSVNRSREGIKRRRSERIERSPMIKISKLRNTKSTVSTVERRSSSVESKSLETVTPDIDNELNLIEDAPNPSKMPRLSPVSVERREGYSRKRELSLYQTLRQKNSLMSHGVLQSNTSVEDDYRDQVINQARLHRLLAAFQAKDDDSSVGNRSPNLFNSRPLQISLGTEANISPSPASTIGLLSIAPIPLSEPVAKSPSESWVPRIDTTTTTTSLTTLSSTGSDRQEVEKIHVSSFPSPTTDVTVLSSSNSSQLQQTTALTATSSILGTTLMSPSIRSIKPLVTSSFVSMPLTSSFNLTNPVTANLSLPTKMSVIPSVATTTTTTTSNAFVFGETSTPKTKQPGTTVFGQQSAPAIPLTFDFGEISTPSTKLPETPTFGQQLHTTIAPNAFLFGSTATPKADQFATPVFDLQSPSNKFESGNNIQQFQFATPQPVATGTPHQTFNPLKLTGNGVQSTATTTGGFNFNMNSTTSSAPSTSAFTVNTCFGQAATAATAFNTSNSTGIFNFAASTTAANGPTIPSFNPVTTSGPIPGLASQFTFGQSRGFSFNFPAEPSSVGLSNRKSIQARRRTSRQH
uniref:Uncharacterized protein n=1 Tax=Strigamia maritima TaxID=126957 RepID=T1JBJ0_STRMM